MPDKEQTPKLDPALDIEVPVCVVLAERNVPLERILELRPGAILDFPRRHDSPLELHVNGSRVGRGRAVDVGERLAFLVDEIEASASSEPPSKGP